MNRHEIKQIALQAGFTLKDQGDLKPYVYEFAERLVEFEREVLRAETEEEMARFMSVAVLICQNEADEWDSDRLQTHKNYADACGQLISRLSAVSAKSWLVRKQAEAIEQMAAHVREAQEDYPTLVSVGSIYEGLLSYASKYRGQADELERVGT